MSHVVRAEARKFTSTRGQVALAAGAVLYPLLGVVAAATAPEAQAPVLGPDTLPGMLRGSAEVVGVVVLLLGIVAVTGEHRHGTIVPSLLAVPDRARLFAAKLRWQAIVAGATAGAAALVAVGVGGWYLAANGVALDVGRRDVVLVLTGMLLFAAFYAAVGVSVGALVRHQTAAVAGALVWLLAVENILPIVLHQARLRDWLPGAAATRLLHLADEGAVALVAPALLAVVLVAAALAVTRRSDVD